MTLDEVGQELGLTRERVRQIENAMIARLRAALADCIPDSHPGPQVWGRDGCRWTLPKPSAP